MATAMGPTRAREVLRQACALPRDRDKLLRLEAELVASDVMSDVEHSDSGYDSLLDEDESEDRERSLRQDMGLNLVLKGTEADANSEVHAPRTQEQLLRLLDVPQVAHLWA